MINEMWIYGFASIIMALLWYFIKCNFETILNKLEEITQQRIDCRESLPMRFADKHETKEALEKIAGQLCNHDHRLMSVEHKVTGRDLN